MLPVGQLAVWGWDRLEFIDQRYWDLVGHTFTLGLIAALLTICGAFILAFSNRYYRDSFTRFGVRVGTLGYALPGSVLAVGVMLSLTWIDNRFADGLEWILGYDPGLFFSGTVFALIMAYFVRFLAVAFGPIDSSLERIRPTLREAARSMAARSMAVFR